MLTNILFLDKFMIIHLSRLSCEQLFAGIALINFLGRMNDDYRGVFVPDAEFAVSFKYGGQLLYHQITGMGIFVPREFRYQFGLIHYLDVFVAGLSRRSSVRRTAFEIRPGMFLQGHMLTMIGMEEIRAYSDSLAVELPTPEAASSFYIDLRDWATEIFQRHVPARNRFNN